MNGAGRILTIPPGRPFLDTLAAGLMSETKGSAEVLADYLILLPTRRACRALADAFLRVSGGRPLILPAIRPLGDVDEDTLQITVAPGQADLEVPPAISEPRRHLLLARMISTWKAEPGMSADQAFRLAAELARFLDHVQTERLDFQGLGDLVPSEFAQHWQDTLAFLAILTEHWPAILAQEGCIDPADRRNRLLAAQARAWRDTPPTHPVIAAGTTGSVPATADLLAVIATLPTGRIVLPGLDREMDTGTCRAVRADPTHPQHMLTRLLDRLDCPIAEIGEWQPEASVRSRADTTARIGLIAEAMRPAATSDAWRKMGAVPAETFAGLERVDCANESEEAGVIALMLRDALEAQGKTAALVTPDRRLARRVAAALERWGIRIDDSAGQPLGDTPPGAFLRLVVRAAARQLAPVALLAALKHPLAAGGMEPPEFRRLVRDFEILALRGPRPAPGISGLRAIVGASSGSAPLLDAIERHLVPFQLALESGLSPLDVLLSRHIEAAEALAASAGEDGARRLWAREDGEALATALAEILAAADVAGKVEGAEYAALFEAMIAGLVVRPRYGLHPRVHIWGPLEARLLHADLMVLGGLNEGSWPPDPGNDPWMSRPMRSRFGLPAQERRIGLSAHDFAQAFAAPKVALVRATRSEGAPTVPSRWLVRLDTVLKAGRTEGQLRPSRPWPQLYHALSRPQSLERTAPPAPMPPVAARPRELSVTRVEMWMRDPYALYAEQILKLKALEPLEADPGAADRGTYIHDALDEFVRRYPDRLPDDALAQLIACGEQAFGDALARPAVLAFWWPRFLRIASWFVDRERDLRRSQVVRSATEVSGRIELPAPGGRFALTAKADRIDRLADGSYSIVDYKTGTVPSEKMVRFGYSPQLPLEAVILADGGFAGLQSAPIAELAYWRLSGGEPPGQVVRLKDDIADLSERARIGLRDLVAVFDDPATPYHSLPRPDWLPNYSDYDHLARVKEWSAGPDGDGG